jgi:hypothetical protein
MSDQSLGLSSVTHNIAVPLDMLYLALSGLSGIDSTLQVAI